MFSHISEVVSDNDYDDENVISSTANGVPSPHRKRGSKPLMPSFMVSAPGKVIAFGEHAVVYGKSAIAASISLRSYLLVSFRSKSKFTISLKFPDIGLSHTWNINDLPWAKFSHPSKRKYFHSKVTSLDPELVRELGPHLDKISIDSPDDVRKIHQSSATAFLYLLLSLGSPSFKPCLYILRSTIPIGAGLGSSASITVCLAAALLLQMRALSGPHEDQPPEEAYTQVSRINMWAYVGEMCIHGNPSGVDNTVASQGKAVIFQRLDYSKDPTIKPLRKFPKLPLLLIDTRQPKSTVDQVKKVATLRKSYPAITESILNAIDMVANGAIQVLTNDGNTENSQERVSEIGKLMSLNHGLLVALGVSHPRLERLRELIDYEGLGWTKLTGAGGGGCAITLLKTDISHEEKTRLEATLIAENFNKFETTLGCSGVGVLWPAVLKNGNEDDFGGEEIDCYKFLNADGIDGVEKLVGVCSEGSNREAWKYWSDESS
ncbi:Mevalonate kinase [Erysiphe neolycopersici]|uniref:Mevalonate kinase n=1 Tax=Erysiphe neolycopersici TaxID=212602 RepID=A0A420HN17_9PEZI|nr:Mevalonate kinase [Erysiphe neolycopersici]